jgi:hypothetical protein
VLAVEPDNDGRYVYSSVPAGRRAFERALVFFDVLSTARGERAEGRLGPTVPGLFASKGIEPIAVRLFPVSHVSLGAVPPQLWSARRSAVEAAIDQTSSSAARERGREYLDALKAYETEAAAAGPAFVEIQNTMLFATVGQKS